MTTETEVVPTITNPMVVETSQNLKPVLQQLTDDGFKLFMSTAHEESKNYPDALEVWRAAALVADGFTIYADKPQEMWRIARNKNRNESGEWVFKIYKMENA